MSHRVCPRSDVGVPGLVHEVLEHLVQMRLLRPHPRAAHVDLGAGKRRREGKK